MQPMPLADAPCVLVRPVLRAPAGFPSPADDDLEERLDLHGYLVRRPAATYVMQVDGDSMKGAGILHGDLVVIDEAEAPTPGRIVIAVQLGEFTIKRLRRDDAGSYWLCPENRDRPELKPVRCLEDCELWGVVVGCVRRFA